MQGEQLCKMGRCCHSADGAVELLVRETLGGRRLCARPGRGLVLSWMPGGWSGQNPHHRTLQEWGMSARL